MFEKNKCDTCSKYPNCGVRERNKDIKSVVACAEYIVKQAYDIAIKPMRYNLKNTETSEAETLKHCLTVIKAKLEEADQLFEASEDYLSTAKWKEAERYIKSYIKELFKQNNL